VIDAPALRRLRDRYSLHAPFQQSKTGSKLGGNRRKSAAREQPAAMSIGREQGRAQRDLQREETFTRLCVQAAKKTANLVASRGKLPG